MQLARLNHAPLRGCDRQSMLIAGKLPAPIIPDKDPNGPRLDVFFDDTQIRSERPLLRKHRQKL